MAQIKKRGKLWYSDFRQDGQRIRRPLSIYKEKAEELLQDLLQIRKSAKDGIQPKDVSFFFFEEKYLRFRQSEFKAGTYAKDLFAFAFMKKYGRPALRLRQVTPEYLIDLGIRAKEKGVPKRTVSGHLRQLKTAMKMAEMWGMIPVYSWRIVKILPDQKRVEYFDYGQLQKVICLTKEGHWKTAAMLMAYAGLRSGETRHLEFSDLDFENRQLYIRIKEDWRPKGSRGQNLKERVVDMIDDLYDYLDQLPKASGYVLGSLLDKDTYKRYFSRLSKPAGFNVFPHKFRHTFASIMISSGVGLDELGPIMGHTDHRSTAVYSHLLPHARRAAANKMQATLRQHMPPPLPPHLEVVA